MGRWERSKDRNACGAKYKEPRSRARSVNKTRDGVGFEGGDGVEGAGAKLVVGKVTDGLR